MPRRLLNGTAKEKSSRMFSVFGVRISLVCKDATLLERSFEALRNFFPMPLRAVNDPGSAEEFAFRQVKSGYELKSPFGEATYQADEGDFIKALRNLVRVAIAANARRHLFIHAGVVGIGGQALVIPGDSHSGKTSLVKALVEQGALYYSDEYAIVDKEGLVLPFAKSLSVRGIEGPHIQTDVAPESLSAKVGKGRIPIGCVLFTNYAPRARWNPRQIGAGEGRLLLIPHMIGLYKRPAFSLKMLEKALFHAKMLTSKRGDAMAVARKILDTLEK